MGVMYPQMPDKSGLFGPIIHQNVNITIVAPAGTEPAGIPVMKQQAISIRCSRMEQINLGFTELEIHDNYVIGRTAEGETMTLAKHEQAMAAVRSRIDGRFTLVLDDVNSYSIDLDVMFAVRDDHAISAICVIAYRDSTRLVLKSAREIVKKPVFFFESLEAATLFVTHGQIED